MANKQFTPEVIIAIREKYPEQPLFRADFENVRKVEKNKKVMTYFVPVHFKTLDGKWAHMNLAFVNQIIASNANPPKASEEKDIKHVQIMFRELTEDDLSLTDYDISKRPALLKHNKQLITAYAILAYEYILLVNREIIPECKKKNGKIKFIQGNKKIHSFMQTHRELKDGEAAAETEETTDEKTDENKEENENANKIALPTPLYRMKLKAVPETKKIGYATDKGHVYTVFDMQKTNKEHKAGNNVKVPAKIKSNGKMVDLDVFNVKHFITFMSLTAGILSMDSICLSSMGISMMNAFRELGVWRHKTLKQETFNSEIVNALTEFGVENEEEDINLDKDDEKSNKTDKFDKSDKSDKRTKLSANIDRALDEDEELNNLDEPTDQTEETQNDEPDASVEEPEEPEDMPKKKSTRGRRKA